MRNISHVLLLALATLAFIGCATCIDFEDQTSGTQFDYGTQIVSDGVPIDVGPMLWSDDTISTTGRAAIDNRGYARGSGLDINARNASLAFDFGGQVTSLTFRYGELGGNVNLRVNGDLRNVQDLHALDGGTIGTLQIHVNALQQGTNRYGELILTGGVLGDFSIAGQELWVDDVCYVVDEDACSAAVSDLTTGAVGTDRPSQSFNETRAIDVTVVGAHDRLVDSMTLSGLNIATNSSALVGARIYHGTMLIASADAPVSGGADLTVSVPIAATLTTGESYRVAFYVATTPPSGGSGNLIEASNMPYVEATGTFRINSTHGLNGDAYPSSSNLFMPRITIDSHCAE